MMDGELQLRFSKSQTAVGTSIFFLAVFLITMIWDWISLLVVMLSSEYIPGEYNLLLILIILLPCTIVACTLNGIALFIYTKKIKIDAAKASLNSYSAKMI